MKITKKKEIDFKKLSEYIVHNYAKKDVKRLMQTLKTNKIGEGKEEQQLIRNKFTQSQNNIYNNAVEKNNNDFQKRNEDIKQQLNKKANDDNKGFIKMKNDKRKEAREYMEFLKSYGWDGISDGNEWVTNYEKEKGFLPVQITNKDGSKKWIMKQSRVSRNLVDNIEQFGAIGKVLKTVGLDKAVMGVSSVLNNINHAVLNPNIKNFKNLGKSAIDVTNTALDLQKQGVKGFVKQAGTNIAKEGIKQLKK